MPIFHNNGNSERRDLERDNARLRAELSRVELHAPTAWRIVKVLSI